MQVPWIFDRVSLHAAAARTCLSDVSHFQTMAEGLLARLPQGRGGVERPYIGIWFLAADCIIKGSTVFSGGLSKRLKRNFYLMCNTYGFPDPGL